MTNTRDSAILLAFSAIFFLAVYVYPEEIVNLVKDEGYKEYLTFEILTLGVFTLGAFSSLVFWLIVVAGFLLRFWISFFVSALASGFYGLYDEIIWPLMNVSAFGEWSPTGAFLTYWLAGILVLSAAQIATSVPLWKGLPK